MNPVDLPQNGKPVKVWPFPGRRAQVNERPVDAMGGGRWMRRTGETVVWNDFHHHQLMGGAILLHPPPCEEHDFGERFARGSIQHDFCQNCGRTTQEAQAYDAAAEPARALYGARLEREAKLERCMTDDELARHTAEWHAQAQAVEAPAPMPPSAAPVPASAAALPEPEPAK